jgi:hypothetical protein
VVDGLSSKCEALSSTLVLQEKKKKKKGNGVEKRIMEGMNQFEV